MQRLTDLKAVVFDLDDTLLHDDLSISDYSVSVFCNLHQKGFYVIAASGRAQLSMKPYVEQLNCVDIYISCNGAEIWDSSHHLIRQEMLPTDTALDIVRFGEKHDCYMQVYEGNCFFFNRYGVYAEKYASSAKLNGIYAGKLSDFIHEPRNKILMMDEESRIASMYAEARSVFAGKASVTCSKPVYLEFNPLMATKGIALSAVADYLGIGTDEMIVFGDSLNDLSMLQAAGIAVCVSNGWKEIMPFCDHICMSNNQDGPAHFLQERYLSEEVTV